MLLKKSIFFSKGCDQTSIFIIYAANIDKKNESPKPSSTFSQKYELR